ncbi:MAG: hypothetical protein JXN10_10955 [Clostridia bacterium]|nr:hypothetical protein [Clostridia bacterium]MBN2884038.1 hypothetical protein [Clostridia bacterium]
MKKLLLLILCFTLTTAIYGCNNNSNQEDINKPDIETSTLKVSLFYPISHWYIPESERIENWSTYLNSKYYLDFQIVYFDNNNFNAINAVGDSDYGVGTDLGYIEEISKLDGLIYVSNKSDLLKLVKAGLIIPLNEYSDGFAESFGIETPILKQFQDKEGNLWALPLRKGARYTYRRYRSDWLEECKLSVPATLDEFRVYGMKIKEKYNSCTAEFLYSLFLRDFEDIFNAYGLYPDNTSPVGYNPKTGKVENLVLTENFKEAMAYIKNLYDEGIIQERDFQNESTFASSIGSTGDEAFVDYAYGLSLSAESYPRIDTGDAGFGLAVLKETKNAEEQIAGFCRILENGQEGALDLWWGINGEDYIVTDEYILIYRVGDENNTSNPPFVATGLWENTIGPTVTEETLPQFEFQKEMMLMNKKTYYEIKGSSNQFTQYSKPLWAYNTEIYLSTKDLSEHTEKLFRNVLENNMSIDDAVAEYKEMVVTADFLEMLAEIND